MSLRDRAALVHFAFIVIAIVATAIAEYRFNKIVRICAQRITVESDHLSAIPRDMSLGFGENVSITRPAPNVQVLLMIYDILDRLGGDSDWRRMGNCFRSQGERYGGHISPIGIREVRGEGVCRCKPVVMLLHASRRRSAVILPSDREVHVSDLFSIVRIADPDAFKARCEYEGSLNRSQRVPRCFRNILRPIGLVSRLGREFMSIRSLFSNLFELLSNQTKHLVSLSAAALHLFELATHHLQLAVINAQSNNSNESEDAIYYKLGTFHPTKFPRKLSGSFLLIIGSVIGIWANFALGWRGWNHWRLSRRLTFGIGGWGIAVILVCHGTRLLLGIN
jgi:hypothetical protein